MKARPALRVFQLLLTKTNYPRLSSAKVVGNLFKSTHPASHRALSSAAAVKEDAETSEFSLNSQHRPSNLTSDALESNFIKLDAEVRRIGRVPATSYTNLLNDIISNQQLRLGPTQALLLIRCAGSFLIELTPSERNALFDRLWSDLEAKKVRLDVSHYNAVLKVYLDNSREFEPAEFLALMESNGVVPNRVTYQRVLAYYCQKGDMDASTKVLQLMKDKGMPVNEFVFRSLIQGYARSGDLENARNTLDLMRSSKIEPDAAAYTAFAQVFAEKGDVEQVKMILSEAREKHGVELSDRDIFKLIIALTRGNHVSQINEIITLLRKTSGYVNDCMNAVIELINLNECDTAFKLLQTTPPTENNSNYGIVFLRHAVSRGVENDKILAYCEQLFSSGLNEYAYHRALEATFNHDRHELASLLIKRIGVIGMPLKAHYFWPFFAKAEGTEDVEAGLKLMKELRVVVSSETLLDYIMQALKNLDEERIMSLTKDYIPLRMAVSGLVMLNLEKGNVARSVQLLDEYDYTTFNALSIKNTVSNAIIRSQDLDNCAKLIRLCDERQDRTAQRRNDVSGEILYLTARNSQGVERGKFLNLLNQCVTQNVKISETAAENIAASQSASDAEVRKILRKLVSTSKGSDALESEFHPKTMDVPALESHLIELETKGMSTRGVLRRLFLDYARQKDLTNLTRVKEKLDQAGFQYSNGMSALLMDTYAVNNQLENALEIYDNLIRQADFKMDSFKLNNLIRSMVERGKVDDALEVLRLQFERNNNELLDMDSFNRSVFRVLSAAAETKDAPTVARIWEAYQSYSNLKPTGVLMGPLIKVHLNNNDWPAAIQAFHDAATKYRTTPWSSYIMEHFIAGEDAAGLQKIMDLCTLIHGEQNTLYDLGFCFISLGRKQQAAKVFETPGLRARHDRLTYFLERLMENNNIEGAEMLVDVCKNLFDIDRDAIYYQLLRAYRKTGLIDKALVLWTNMQEEGIQASATTLRYLASFLREHKREVPFVEPGSELTSLSRSKTRDDEPLIEAIKSNNLQQALEIKNSIEARGVALSFRTISSLIDLLVREGELAKAKILTLEMLAKESYPMPPVLKHLLTQLNMAGDIESVEAIGEKLPESICKFISYDAHRVNAYVNAGKTKDILQELEERAPDHPVVPANVLFRLLMTKSEYLEDVKRLAKVYSAEGSHKVSSVLWEFYFRTREFEKCEELERNCADMLDEIRVSRICRSAFEDNDVEMVQLIIDDSAKKANLKNVAFACGMLVEQLTHNAQYDKAQSVISDAEKKFNIGLHNFQFRSLSRLHKAMVEAGMQPNFELPENRSPRRGRDDERFGAVAGEEK